MTRLEISKIIQSNQVARPSTRNWMERIVDKIYDDLPDKDKKAINKRNNK